MAPSTPRRVGGEGNAESVSTKQCRKCHTAKPLSDFPKDRTSKDGLYSRCRSCVAIEGRERRDRDPEAFKRKAAERMRRWRKRNPERTTQLQRGWYRRAKLRALVAYSQDPPTCSCCGEATLGFLTIDHIDGGGNAHRRELGGGSSLLIWLQRQGYPEGFQVLCFNCNAGRYWNGGDCPHLGGDIVNNSNLLPA